METPAIMEGRDLVRAYPAMPPPAVRKDRAAAELTVVID